MLKLGCSRLLLGGHVLLLCLSASWMLAAADVPAGHRRGCPAKCGDVDIPFPFGIGDECALDGFQLSCETVKGVNRPFSKDFEVTNISVPEGTVRVKTLISWQCYDPATGNTAYSDASSNFSGTNFWISEAENKVIVIGCNTLAYMLSSSYVIGCLSTCEEPLENVLCSGNGCCQAEVPKDVRLYRAYFNVDYDNSQTWRSQNSSCSYMAVMERAALHFRPSYVTGRVFSDTYGGKVPVVLNWQIRPWTCEVARQNASTYACVSSNSECLNSTNEQGYRCRCSDGYQGNPYITDGCQDIDECLVNANRCGLEMICTNTPGNYSCSCHPGKNGRCVPPPSTAVTVSTPPAMLVVGPSVGIVIFVTVVACACLIQQRRKLHHMKSEYFEQHGGVILLEKMKSESKQGIVFKIFSEQELQQATNMFSEERVLGRGGHGTVYKGILKNNVEVAVKRCKTINEKYKKEFGKEMIILSQINHKNIVKLLGCCLEVEVPMLVYELVPNGTLYHLIHDNHGQRISLVARLGIAHESAEALSYLHSGVSTQILHGDVKSSNILLDADHKAKVSDFGASILAPNDESQFVTLVQGTCGYLDPEYMQTCQLTDKSDVYSFGVVLLELLTGKKPFNLDSYGEEKSLSMMFLSAMKANKLEEILDDEIKDEDNMDIFYEIAELAKQCLDMCGENRPPMKEVAEKLDRLREVIQQHPWVQQQQNLEEIESLLGEPLASSPTATVSGEYFSIEKKVVNRLQSGR
uniref:Uncharacterized protein n=1 Tax=Avena sativa TaxID=4498 RepID=A0ACD5Y495_AVESA